MKKRRKRPSLRDVATAAETSMATVSRAITGRGYVAEETRARVLKAARDLNYHPDFRARSLRSRSSHSIGLIIPHLLNAYYTELADTISDILGARRYQLLLASTRDDLENEKSIINDMVGYSVDGLIWVPSSKDKKLVEYLQIQDIPAVTIVRRIEDSPIDTVVFEDFEGSKAATEHLISLGHSRISHIGGNIRHTSNYERRRGYTEAMQEAGLSPKSIVRPGNIRRTWGGISTKELFSQPTHPTAIFVSSNDIMPGVVKALRQLAITVPDEISLVCFDDVDWFSFSSPPITAVSVSCRRLAEEAVGILLSHIEDADGQERSPVDMEIPYEMILRSSTAPPRR